MVPSATNITDFTTNEFTKYYEDLTKVHVTWNVVPSDSLQVKVNLSLSSGDMPDVYSNCGISMSQLALYGSQGAFKSLKPYIDKYSALLKGAFKELPWIETNLTMPDGNIYSLPYVEDTLHTSYRTKMWVNKGWLDKLGIAIPKTTDDFYKMLTAFKKNDPNGNGKADEIALSGSIDDTRTTFDSFLMNAFILNDSNNGRKYLDNGKVKVSFNQDGFREGLKYLNKLYKEGLVDPQAFTQKTTQLRQIVENPAAEVLGAVPGLTPIGFDTSGSSRWKQMVAIPPLTGPNGNKVALYNPYGSIDFTRIEITKSCKNPEVAFRWAVEQYPVAMNYRKTFGVKGTNWLEAKPGQNALDGSQADVMIFTDGVAWGDQQNYCWRNHGLRFESFAIKNEYKIGITNELEIALYKNTKENYVPYAEKMENILPPLPYSTDQANVIADVGTVLNNYVAEMVARFITGDANLDTEWDSYINQLNVKGLSKFLEATQSAYDLKTKK